MRTPLLLSFHDIELMTKEDPILPKDLNDLDGPLFLAPRYYIKINSPTNNRAMAEEIIQIPRAGILANTIRITLPPSTGIGINSCYRVQYWQWDKVLYPPSYSMEGPYYVSNPYITKYKNLPNDRHTFIREEYWHVPPIERPSPLPYRHKAEKNTIRVMRHDSNVAHPNIDFLDSIDVISICDITDENNNTYMDYSLIEVPHANTIKYLSGEHITKAIGIAWGRIYPRPSTYYQITYIKPFTLSDIRFIEDPPNYYHKRYTHGCLQNSFYPHL